LPQLCVLIAERNAIYLTRSATKIPGRTRLDTLILSGTRYPALAFAPLTLSVRVFREVAAGFAAINAENVDRASSADRSFPFSLVFLHGGGGGGDDNG